jgi:DMSO/TMAO reductase YedYZ heme-binding membrane subunit
MDQQLAHDQFIHIRIIIGIVTGLTVTRLLTGRARFVQHPSRDRIYLVHLGWALFLLLAIVHFWWFEFGLARIEVWTFEVYFFVICYAAFVLLRVRPTVSRPDG